MLRHSFPLTVFLTVLFGVVLLAPVVARGGMIRLLTPADKGVVEGDRLHLAGEVAGSGVALLAVAGRERSQVTLRRQQGRRLFCLAVPLSPGLNSITLTATTGGGAVVAREGLTVYRRSRLLKPYQEPPAGYHPYTFHLPAAEAFCSPCHRMAPNLADLFPATPERSPCLPCHADKGHNRYLHRPAAGGACLLCHLVGGAGGRYHTSRPDRTGCFLCHSAQERQWNGMKVHHGPTAMGDCTLCHDPHGAEWPALVRMHPTDLCVNCHDDKKSGLHVIAGFFAKGHPVKGPVNPLKKDRPFSCAGCHNPHAGDSRNLLNRERGDLNVYCQSCHTL